MTNEVDMAQGENPDAAKSQRSRGVWLFLRDILLIFLAALLISFLIKTFLIRSFYIPSESMEDTLIRNDRIIVNQLTPDLTPLNRGDVVVFQDPGGWLDSQIEVQQPPFLEAVDTVLSFVGLSAADSNDHLIKRIIGLPGDNVVCCDDFGRVSVNGVPLTEPYIKLPSGAAKSTPEDFDIVVPDDSLWVMGDNRYSSADSAFHHLKDPGHEYVPLDDVVGRAVVISWPISRWTWLDNYPLVFSEIDSEQP
ncbi:MAG TPA: signal peptidase I [Glaciihabitans sp.]|jgi:signal peptidase I|nr:signal peptidase I [Glaciihabitans sp.]